MSISCDSTETLMQFTDIIKFTTFEAKVKATRFQGDGQCQQILSSSCHQGLDDDDRGQGCPAYMTVQCQYTILCTECIVYRY